MLLLVGLGNPGAAYQGNRHNIGFMVLDAVQRAQRGSPWRKKFQSELSEITLGETRAVLLKPQTYMNDSGRAVGEAMRFHKIDLKDIFVFHDELDLAPGRLRLKRGGGTAGHNGLRSISAHCGNDYARVRIGIGHPGDKALVHNHVLGDFAKSERPWLEDLCRSIAANVETLTAKDESLFGTRVHLAMVERGHGKAEAATPTEPPKKAGHAGEPR